MESEEPTRVRPQTREELEVWADKARRLLSSIVSACPEGAILVARLSLFTSPHLDRFSSLGAHFDRIFTDQFTVTITAANRSQLAEEVLKWRPFDFDFCFIDLDGKRIFEAYDSMARGCINVVDPSLQVDAALLKELLA